MERSQVAKVPNGVETLPKISIAWVGCTNVTDDRQTDGRIDGRRHIANMNMSSRSLKIVIIAQNMPVLQSYNNRERQKCLSSWQKDDRYKSYLTKTIWTLYFIVHYNSSNSLFTHDFIGKTRKRFVLNRQYNVQQTADWRKTFWLAHCQRNCISIKGQLHQQHLKLQLTTYKLARKTLL